VGALAAFAMFFTMLERHYTTAVKTSCCNLFVDEPLSRSVPILIFSLTFESPFRLQQQNVCHMLTTQHSSFLYTVSRLVSSRDIRRRGSEEEGGRLLHVTDPDPTIKPKTYPKPPVMQTLFYIHVIAFFAILTLCWLDTLPGIGRVSLRRNDEMKFVGL